MKIKVTEKTEKESFSLHKWPWWLGLGEAKITSLELHLDLINPQIMFAALPGSFVGS